MSDANSVQPALATLTAAGWVVNDSQGSKYGGASASSISGTLPASTAIFNPAQGITTWNDDGLGRPASVVIAGVTYTVNKDAVLGRLTSIVGGGTTRTQQYDAFGQVTGEALT